MTAGVQDTLFFEPSRPAMSRANLAATRLRFVNRYAAAELARLNRALDATTTPDECLALAAEGERLRARISRAVTALQTAAAECGVLL